MPRFRPLRSARRFGSIAPEVESVGVVIPTLGERSAWLRMCLASVLMQEEVDAKVVLVGPSGVGLEELAEEFSVGFISAEPAGLSRAINSGLDQLLDCELVTWLGDDDLLAPGSLGPAARALRAAPDARFVYGRTRYIDPSGLSIYVSRPTRFAPYYARIGQDYIPQPGSIFRSRYNGAPVRLDPGLRNAMDLDLFLRLAQGGRNRWVYLHKEVSAYRIHEGAITSNKGSFDEAQAVRERFVSPSAVPFLRFSRRFLVLMERLFVGILWRLPVSRPPLVGGQNYIVWLERTYGGEE